MGQVSPHASGSIETNQKQKITHTFIDTLDVIKRPWFTCTTTFDLDTIHAFLVQFKLVHTWLVALCLKFIFHVDGLIVSLKEEE